MKIKMRTIASGPSFSGGPGEVVDVDAATAKALIDGGYAVEVKRETAVVTQKEIAATVTRTVERAVDRSSFRRG